MIEPMDEEIRKILKKDHREHLYALWSRAKEGNFDGLTDGIAGKRPAFI